MSILVSNILNQVISKSYETAFVFGMDGFYDSCLATMFQRLYCNKDFFVNINSLKCADRQNLLLVDSLPLYRNIDLVINNDIDLFGKQQMKMFGPNIRTVYVEHRCTEFLKKEDVYITKRLYQDKEIVFSNAGIQESWQLDGWVIPEFFTPDIAKQEKDIDVLIYGDFEQADYSVVTNIASQVPKAAIIGNNPGLSRAVSYVELLETIARAKVLVTFSPGVHAPQRVLEAAHFETAVVSNACEASNTVIDNNSTGLLCGPGEIATMVHGLVQDAGWTKSLTTAAKSKYINQTKENFVSKWSALLYE